MIQQFTIDIKVRFSLSHAGTLDNIYTESRLILITIQRNPLLHGALILKNIAFGIEHLYISRQKLGGNIEMRTIGIAVIAFALLSACGTARGVLHGSSVILEGVASDTRAVGDWLQ